MEDLIETDCDAVDGETVVAAVGDVGVVVEELFVAAAVDDAEGVVGDVTDDDGAVGALEVVAAAVDDVAVVVDAEVADVDVACVADDVAVGGGDVEEIVTIVADEGKGYVVVAAAVEVVLGVDAADAVAVVDDDA